MNHLRLLLFLLSGLCLTSCKTQKDDTQRSTAPFTLAFSGAMRNVMHNGELYGTIALDTISNKTHLYGLGPIEYLTGEILILDGTTYISTVTSDTTMHVSTKQDVKAPFFVYANVPEWKEYPLPDSIVTEKEMEHFLDATITDLPRPFPFFIKGRVKTANIHIVNLPKGTEVHSPEDAHTGQIDYLVSDKPVEMLGFFSNEHKGIFIHHSSLVHIHLMTEDKTMMGHVDSLEIMQGKARLYLPSK